MNSWTLPNRVTAWVVYECVCVWVVCLCHQIENGNDRKRSWRWHHNGTLIVAKVSCTDDSIFNHIECSSTLHVYASNHSIHWAYFWITEIVAFIVAYALPSFLVRVWMCVCARAQNLHSCCWKQCGYLTKSVWCTSRNNFIKNRVNWSFRQPKLLLQLDQFNKFRHQLVVDIFGRENITFSLRSGSYYIFTFFEPHKRTHSHVQHAHAKLHATNPQRTIFQSANKCKSVPTASRNPG